MQDADDKLLYLIMQCNYCWCESKISFQIKYLNPHRELILIG